MAPPRKNPEEPVEKVNLGWTDQHEAAARAVFERMEKEGIPARHNGKMNRTVVVLYALQQQSRRPPNL